MCNCTDICEYQCGTGSCKSQLMRKHYAINYKKTATDKPVEEQTFAASSYRDGTGVFGLKLED